MTTYIHALNDLAEHDVLAVQPGGLHGGNEELASARSKTQQNTAKHSETGEKVSANLPKSGIAEEHWVAPVGSRAGVGHGQVAGAVVLDLEVLVREASAVDALAANASAVGEITALDHELGNHAVEGAAPHRTNHAK